MTSSTVHARASGSILLHFDGEVLEVFGEPNALRFHVAEGLSMEISEGRGVRCSISTDQKLRISLNVDVERVEDVRKLARAVEFAIQ